MVFRSHTFPQLIPTHSFLFFLILTRGHAWGTGAEGGVNVRENHGLVAFHTCLYRDWTCNPAVCPNWGWQPFGAQDDIQLPEPLWPGPTHSFYSLFEADDL